MVSRIKNDFNYLIQPMYDEKKASLKFGILEQNSNSSNENNLSNSFDRKNNLLDSDPSL